MNTTTDTPPLPPEVRADIAAVAAAVAEGRPVDPEVAARIRALAEKARQETLARHGVQDIGVQIIRELRGELPE